MLNNDHLGSPISALNFERMVEQRLRATDLSDLTAHDGKSFSSHFDDDLNLVNLSKFKIIVVACSLLYLDFVCI